MRSSVSVRGFVPTAGFSSTSTPSRLGSSRLTPTSWATRPSVTWRRGSWTGRRSTRPPFWQGKMMSGSLGCVQLF
eukprot:9484123-Pyramimonas_sp.AAC.1